MSGLVVRLLSVGRCEVVHEASGASVVTATPREYGGTGGAFSATDLLAAALGVCIATNIDRILVRHGVPLEALRLRVEKTLGLDPKRVASLRVTILLTGPVSDRTRTVLMHAADQCTVHRSLHPSMDIRIELLQEG